MVKMGKASLHTHQYPRTLSYIVELQLSQLQISDHFNKPITENQIVDVQTQKKLLDNAASL